MDLWVCQLGRLPYREALDLQHRVRAARQDGRIPDVLLLLEHDAVYTRGRRSADGELPLGEDWYAELGIEIVDVDRGGKVTYHGPGQLVGYPVMAVDHVRDFVDTMEQAVIAALAEEGVHARSRAHEGLDFIGVWVEDRKIASVGINVQRGVTTHGFAVNVDNDLTPFEWVVPCGLGGVQMTSIARERTDGCADPTCFRKRMAYRFAQATGHRQRLVSRRRLESAIAPTPAPV